MWQVSGSHILRTSDKSVNAENNLSYIMYIHPYLTVADLITDVNDACNTYTTQLQYH
jgi:hypothetical protein